MFKKIILASFISLTSIMVVHAYASPTDNIALLSVDSSDNRIHYGTAFVVENTKYQTGNNLLITAMHVTNEGSATGKHTTPKSIKVTSWNGKPWGNAEVLFCGKGRLTEKNITKKAQEDICVLSIPNPTEAYTNVPGLSLGKTHDETIITVSQSEPAPSPGASGAPLIIDNKVYGFLSTYSSKANVPYSVWSKSHLSSYAENVSNENIHVIQKYPVSTKSICNYGKISNEVFKFLRYKPTQVETIDNRLATSYGFPYLLKSKMDMKVIKLEQ